MKPDFELSNFLPYLLNQAAEKASADFAAVYKSKYGLQRTDWRVVAHLGEFGALSARQICDRAGEHKTKVSRAVSRLESMGLLHRASSDQDRRTEILDLTLKGQRTYRDLTKLAEDQDANLADQLGGEVVKDLKSVLLSIADLKNP